MSPITSLFFVSSHASSPVSSSVSFCPYFCVSSCISCVSCAKQLPLSLKYVSAWLKFWCLVGCSHSWLSYQEFAVTGTGEIITISYMRHSCSPLLPTQTMWDKTNTEIQLSFLKITESDVTPLNFWWCTPTFLSLFWSHQDYQPIILHSQHCWLTEPSQLLIYMKTWPFKSNSDMNFKYSWFSTQINVPDFQRIWTGGKLFCLVTAEKLIHYLTECFISLSSENVNS